MNLKHTTILGKKFCTLGFSGKFYLDQDWLHFMLYIVVINREIILQPMGKHKIEIEWTLTKLTVSI